MSFVHDNEVRAVIQEHAQAVALLNVINGNHLERNVAEHILVGTQLLFQSADSTLTDNLSIQAEFIFDFVLPLFAKVGQTNNSKTVYLVPVKQFFCDEQRL